jgi:hypothetical protein
MFNIGADTAVPTWMHTFLERPLLLREPMLRHRLLVRPNTGPSRNLTLLSALPGSGKTTLLAPSFGWSVPVHSYRSGTVQSNDAHELIL